MNICEYATVATVKAYKDTDSKLAVLDALILRMIRQASREMEDITNRKFYPYSVSEKYDTPKGDKIIFDHDMLSVSSVTNGDGSVIDQANYLLYPLNDTPKIYIKLLPVSETWRRNSYGLPDGAIGIDGLAGYRPDYDSAFIALATPEADITAIASSFEIATGLVESGMLLQVESEFMYASAVTKGTTDIVSVIRGVNGSTAAAHSKTHMIYQYDPGSDIEALCTRAALAYTKLRSNPIGESITIDGVSYTTPKDVMKWMDQQLTNMGKIRTGLR